MEIWASANQKGGVGKTTTVVNLGALMAQQGLKVLLVDLDPHGSLTSYFGLDPDNTPASVADIFDFDGKIPPHPRLVSETKVRNLSLLPANTRQATLDRRLATKSGMGLTLSTCLLSWEKHFDYVLLDCPPTLGVLMVNALAACERVLIPVQTDFLATQGLRRMRNTLRMVGSSTQQTLPQTIIPTFFDSRTRASEIALSALRKEFAQDLWSGVIPIDTKFRDASRVGLPLSAVAPNSHGIAAYGELLRHLQYETFNATKTYQEAV